MTHPNVIDLKVTPADQKRYTFEQRTAKLIGIKAMFSHRFDVEIKINIKCALILMGS